MAKPVPSQPDEQGRPDGRLDRPLPFSLSFFQRAVQHITEHYDSGPHEDRQGNSPCEDTYCKVNPADETILRAMFEAMEPMIFDFIDQFDFTEHDSLAPLRERVGRVARHKHECGQRTTSGPVVVESA